MALIEFKDLPDTTTPVTAENLNNNFEELDNKIDNLIEEDSWTPTISAWNETAPTLTYTSRRGYYKKIGNIVFFDFYIRAKITALNGTNNYAQITGLPYASINHGFGSQAGSIGALYSAVYNPHDTKFIISGDNIRIQHSYGAEAAKWVVTSTSYMEIGGSGFYFVA